ncbi:ATP-dependent bile acid permease [Wolfiporia cocos MD-104 SS10]|uniref:ATP-dependent bile acid permease n=1 Tax=Wolfiporia cocos (strain MD-104) TaxID=742152 RepID=A0A2H3J9T6_WOLCO|nr:ATP-dependent bile acid permease [Wolfiporia cocos MD-104 SS10]
MRNLFHPQPAPPAFGESKVVPKSEASLLSKLVFSWLDPFLQVGFSRPLQKEDLWQLPHDELTVSLTDVVERNFYARCPPEKRPRFLKEESNFKDKRSSLASTPSMTVEDEKKRFDEEKNVAGTSNGLNIDEKTAAEPELANSEQKHTAHSTDSKKYDESLIKALHSTFFRKWWLAGILTALGNTLNTTTPLLTKVLLNWLTVSYEYWKLSEAERIEFGIAKPRGIGYGIGLAFALFVMQEASSLMTCHYQLTSMEVGLYVRTGVIGAIFRKALRLSGKARLDHSAGQITTMISTDATRLERNTAYAHLLWVSPMQLAIGIGLLIHDLGYSALVGLGVLLIGFPVQLIFVRAMFVQRKAGVVLTDKRVRTITEVLQGIRLIKYYAWEDFFAHQISEVREKEVSRVRRLGFARANLISVVTVIPMLASVLSFITYSLSGHDLNISVIFSSLQLFNIIRAPLMFFPLVFASSTDAVVALGRISKFLVAEELDDPYTVDPDSPFAVDVEGDFAWETAHKATTGDNKPKSGGGPAKKDKKAKPEKPKRGLFGRKGGDNPVLPVTAGLEDKKDEKEPDEKPFELKDLRMKVPKGAFVAVVGPIGSGKSSLLQALIGEMRRVQGHSTFSSSVAYVPQSAWIMNASLRENVSFGQEDNEEKFREIVKACCLEPDLNMLPQGEDTEIGEKGINLSGGQKARVSLARAAYSGADIILMDDSLSAVDAFVGKSILENCLLNGPLAGKTRVLVTHALHVLDKTDYIYVMDNGTIVEQGTFTDLMSNSVVFSRIMDEFGTLEKEEEEGQDGHQENDSGNKQKSKEDQNGPAGLMQAEERMTGAVTWKTYTTYFRYAGGLLWVPLIVITLTLNQGAQVANNLFLGFWTAESIKGFDQADYMGTYAALGAASALFAFMLSFSITLASLQAGLNMFMGALTAVLHSPVSFFDTTPMGRIMSRLSKDQDTIDTELSMIAYQLVSTFSSVLGTVALVFYTFPYLGLIFIPLTILYYTAATFYRRSSVETKRLDSIMRSTLYAAYSESLTGISTVRAYGEETRFVKKSELGLDMENRAYYMTIAIQQWLATRLDLLGNLLVLGIALFAAGFSRTINPSKVGVVLSYTLSITQVFSQLVSTYAQNEQDFNAVERILYYSALPSEGETVTSQDPAPSWPDKGQIEFNSVELAYREGLPLVLKGVSFTVNPGEKIGIVGRTGAGKSSLLQALFRIVNVQGGSITIDDINIREVGLKTLRSRLALVPQDNILFKGTLRENIDPQGSRTDAESISALRRTWLLPRDDSHDPVAEAKFSLDSVVSDEGSNYSAGEKQLLALCRALVKNSRIIVLDEATSNVDVEMDARLQKTIQTEFATSTLLCIAHRLNTIVYYDRILVMDAGMVAEFDTPLNLFDKEDSIFRSLCNEAGISRQDIVRIRASVPAATMTEMETSQ